MSGLRMRLSVAVALLAGSLLGVALQAAAQTSPAADFVFRNGKVYTEEDRQEWAQAVAVRGKEIVYVGDDRGASGLVGPKTQVVDLKGGMLLPGFIEAHIHPTLAWMAEGADLQYDSRDELLAAVRQWAEANPKAPVVRGFGWRYPLFPATGPDKKLLDAVAPDRPVFLIAIDAHSAWVNSKALAAAGITRDTPDPQPPFSTFQRDPKTGEPTGYVVEVPAMVSVLAKLLPVNPDTVKAAMEQIMRKFAAAGITGVMDAGVQGIPQSLGFDLYQEMERSGTLTTRIVGSYHDNNPAEDPLPKILDLRARYHSELVQASVLKINADGGDAQHTGYFLEPYADMPGFRGKPTIPPDVATRVVKEADLHGIDILCHCYGDAATRELLDAIEASIRANPPRDRRNALSHLILVDPADIPRFATTGTVAQFSIQWAVPDAYMNTIEPTRIGQERTNRTYPIRPILDAGGRVTLGTDWPAAGHYSTYKPLESIQIALTRQELNKPDGPILGGAAMRLTLKEALRASTLSGAYQLRLENKVGSIKVGKLADLVVLDQNLFAVPVHEIAKTQVRLTMMNGKVTFRNGL